MLERAPASRARERVHQGSIREGRESGIDRHRFLGRGLRPDRFSRRLVGNPRHYRDEHTDGMREEAFERMPPRALYRETGNAFERYNTLFQILGMLRHSPLMLERARHLLLIADLFVFLLTGVRATEFTAATTTQLLRAGARSWSLPVLQSMGITPRLLTDVELPGSVRGRLSRSVADQLVLPPVPVVAVAHHDTASAVAAIPSFGSDHCFLSSGTWSLMGTEIVSPILTDEAMDLGFTNEGCADGGYRLLKNIMGLWILQECKRTWDSEGTPLEFSELAELAKEEEPFRSLIDPDDQVFFSPGDMRRRIQTYCRETRQPVPESRGALVRCILESLALKYRVSLENIEAVTGKRTGALHIVGGGSRNRLLNQFAADSINRPVIAGPEEAASIGNLMVQAVARGLVRDLSESRKVVRNSFPTEDYSPARREVWDAAFEDFTRLCGRAPSG